MGSKEIQHVVSIEGENLEQSNKMRSDEAKSIIRRNSSSVSRWPNYFFKKHSSTEKKAILLLSVVAIFLDPFFFYIPVVKNASTCLEVDNDLRIIVVVFRSIVDVFLTILWWHHSLPLVHGRYRLTLTWTVFILAILPLPQVVIFAVSWQLLTLDLLKFIVLIQFAIRLCRIVPAYQDATRSSDMLLIHTWFAAAFNLVMYTLSSNVLGAFWYLRAVERNMDCWSEACRNSLSLCIGSSLYCDNTSRHKEYLNKHCSIPQASSTKPFDYGIYAKAIQETIIETSTQFPDKFFQCFWWGLRNLSSLGQNLETGTYIWDNVFAISIAICGLVLFAFFIGNMQTYLQTKTPGRLDKMKQRKIFLRGWKPFYLLPKDLRKEVIWCKDPKWQETTEVNLESLLNNIPTALKKKLRTHLCKDMFEQIPKFKNLCNRPRDELCALAKPLVFSQRSYILREGDPINELVSIVDGNLLAYGKCSTVAKVPVKRLSSGCFFGEELLQQLEQEVGQQQQSPDDEDLPIASITVQATTKVEAFALSARDLKKVFASYRGYLYESDIHNWASSTIQGAWRKKLRSREDSSAIKASKIRLIPIQGCDCAQSSFEKA